MPKEFRLPDLGEGIHEGEVVEVLVSVGDRVVDGKPILVVETDKATTEIPSPVTGVVQEIRVKPGDVIKVGEVLMVFLEDKEAETPRRVEKAEPRKTAKPVPYQSSRPPRRPQLKRRPEDGGTFVRGAVNPPPGKRTGRRPQSRPANRAGRSGNTRGRACFR